jgi:hypothetical protein
MLAAAVARQHARKREMQIAQAGFGRRLTALVGVHGTRGVVLAVRGKMIVKVPDRMRERAVLRRQQQDDASKLQ